MTQKEFLKAFKTKVKRLKTGKWNVDYITGRLRYFRDGLPPCCPLDLFTKKHENAFGAGRRLFGNQETTYKIVAAADNSTSFAPISTRLRNQILKIVGLV